MSWPRAVILSPLWQLPQNIKISKAVKINLKIKICHEYI